MYWLSTHLLDKAVIHRYENDKHVFMSLLTYYLPHPLRSILKSKGVYAKTWSEQVARTNDKYTKITKINQE